MICICPTANWTPKIWPQENFLRLIKKFLYSANLKIIFLFLSDKEEEYKINFYQSRIKIYLICLEEFSLVEILLFLKECKLFIGNDSGLMHLAA